MSTVLSADWVDFWIFWLWFRLLDRRHELVMEGCSIVSQYQHSCERCRLVWNVENAAGGLEVVRQETLFETSSMWQCGSGTPLFSSLSDCHISHSIVELFQDWESTHLPRSAKPQSFWFIDICVVVSGSGTQWHPVTPRPQHEPHISLEMEPVYCK